MPTSASSVSLARSFSGQSTTSTTNNNAAQDTDDEPPLPRYLILPSAPHLLSSSTLAALPLSHLTALVAALSKENEEATLELARKEKEVQVLVGLAREGVKAGEGEIERARVRARVGVGDVASAVEEGQRRKDWRIELLAKEQSPALEQGKEEIEDHTGGVSEVSCRLSLSETRSLADLRLRTDRAQLGRPRRSHLGERLRLCPFADDAQVDFSGRRHTIR